MELSLEKQLMDRIGGIKLSSGLKSSKSSGFDKEGFLDLAKKIQKLTSKSGDE